MWPTLPEWGAVVRLLKGEYLGNLFGILLHERFVSSPPFIHSTIYFYQYGLMEIYFILWVVIPSI